MNIEKQFHSYFNMGLIGMAVTSTEKGWLNVNDKLCEIFGYPREELIKLSWAEITYPDDLKADVDEYERVLAGEIDGYAMDKRFIRKDGSVIYASISVSCIRRDSGKVDHFVAFVQDITARKLANRVLEEERHTLEELINKRTVQLRKEISKHRASEQRFRAFFEQSGALCMVLDPNTLDGIPVILDANKAAYEAHGYTKEEFIGKPVSEIVDEETKQSTQERTQLVLNENQLNVENTHVRKDGSTFSVGVSANRVDIEGELPLIYTTEHDITERIRLEGELLKSRKLESVGLLAGGIAHDFNNILTGLFGNIELAKRKLNTDHAAYTYILYAVQALDKATNLTNQLLTFAKGGDPLLERINIKQIIQESINFSLSGSNVKTALILPDELWQVIADKGQISQVITNLVINADQAMDKGGTLTIEAENIKDVDIIIAPHLSGEVVKLRITDDGSGISAVHLKKIFDPYFTTKQTGSGLGLATVYSIISKHKGHISVDSELDVGASFTIYLPANRSLPKVIDISSANVTKTPVITTGHILVMDDDEMILNLSTEIIESFGYTVDTALDGQETIDKYISAKESGKAFDVVIMDLTIRGGMGGKETIKKLLSLDPEVKVIVSSGYSTDPVMANYREYGFIGRLVKPFQMDELQKKISRLIEK